MNKTIPNLYFLGALAAVAALAWTMQKGNAEKLGEKAGGAVVDLATGLLTGGVQGVGGAVGVPKTNMTECERAKAEGRTLDASFACPAKDFLTYWWNK